MNDTTTLNQAFAAAWTELGERLQRGATTLETMPYQPRRADKLEGLDEAQHHYYAIERSLDPDAEFPQGGLDGWRWHEFTNRVFDAYTRALSQSRDHFASGLALALEYQRGYSVEVDAPGLPILMARAGGRA